MPDARSPRPLSPDYEQPGTDVTLHSLQRVDNETLARLSALTLPEVDQLKQEIANILPAGNLPGLILAGLTNLSERRVSNERAENDINTLFNGANLLPRGLYSLLIAGPAVVLSAYQKLLTLAGKDVDSAFPEGTWQFYLHFGLREDTGRHANETIAYHRDRPPQAAVEDDITAWIMASVYTLFDNDTLNGVVWAEWTTLRFIHEAALQSGVADRPPFADMVKAWQATRPYHTPLGESYAEVRQRAFEEFIQSYTNLLTEEALTALAQVLSASAARSAYQQQMSLLARLEPGRFRDERVRVPIWDARIGLVWHGDYYLFDICQKDERGRPLAFTVEGDHWPVFPDGATHVRDPYGKVLEAKGGWLYRLDESGQPAHPAAYLAPVDPAAVKGQVAGLLSAEGPPASQEVTGCLVGAPRSEQTRLRGLLPGVTQDTVKALSNALIILNWDRQERDQPLGLIRLGAQRGVGDHPLTIMRTADSLIFDQSHIFFDGLWGMALGEVMTNQAVEWCKHVLKLSPQAGVIAPGRLTLKSSVGFKASAIAQHFGASQAESGAETDRADLALIEEAREWLQQRGIRLTVNDFLLLARIVHAADYQPGKGLTAEVERLPADLRGEVESSLQESSGVNPAILIPMDASFVTPHERIYPTTFRNRLTGLLAAYDEALAAYQAYRAAEDDAAWRELEKRRRSLFSYLRAFGEMLDVIKAITMRGESFNTATLRMLAHLPTSMQYLLDQIPQQVGVLNEVVKGEEVFSNVGRVARGSSLTRFMSAKDDGQTKTLVWGVLTDDSGTMHVSLRDFRPHVSPLQVEGYEGLARRLAQDYLDSYVRTLNDIAEMLMRLALAEDEMRWN
jgi:hypothetical protein